MFDSCQSVTNGVVVSCKAKSFQLYSEGDHTTEGSVHASEQHICRLVLVIRIWRSRWKKCKKRTGRIRQKCIYVTELLIQLLPEDAAGGLWQGRTYLW